MTVLTHVHRRAPKALFRPFKLAAFAIVIAGALGLAACQDSGRLAGHNAELALDALKAAPAQGLSAARFQTGRIERLLKSSSGRERAEGERLLRAALIDYGRAQHGASIPSRAFPAEWGLKPAAYDAEAELNAALEAGQLKAWIAKQPTPLAAYGALRQAYADYLTIHATGGWPTVAHVALAPGAQGPQVALLRQRLAFEDASLAAGPQEAPADAALIQALERFQAAHGLPSTGLLDVATVRELNVPALARAAQIRANIERLRWLPREEPATRIDVNTAAAVTDYFVQGQRVMHMLSASGRPGGDETPMLASQVDAIVLNPPWNVPEEIAQDEILPKGEAYLQQMGFVMKDGRLVQQPGPDAALGVVKFDFDNPYAVYLHDTPAKAAFSRAQRAVSHGCVRLAQAVSLAKAMLANEPGWSAARVDEALATRETLRVELKQKTPVRLVYLTAYPENGRIAFRPDVYGWDAKLLRMLDNPPKAAKSGRKT
jgi:murein L,D-transpeptidase YcbB/YkuD